MLCTSLEMAWKDVDTHLCLMCRGDKIELLVDKAEDLGEQANKFKRSGQCPVPPLTGQSTISKVFPNYFFHRK